MSVEVGLGVLETLMAEEADEVRGLPGRGGPDRSAYRHWTGDGLVTLGGRRVPVNKRRARAKDWPADVRPLLDVPEKRYYEEDFTGYHMRADTASLLA